MIFKEGYLDSKGILTLLTYFEEEFALKTIDSDLMEENFESFDAITNFILRKTA